MASGNFFQPAHPCILPADRLPESFTARKTGDNAVFADLWGLSLYTLQQPGDDLDFVGIRAQDIRPCKSLDEENSFSYEIIEEYEDPLGFIRIIQNRDRPALGSIRWEIDHESYRKLHALPNIAKLPSEKVLLLRK
jgi:hypothetical protein